MSRNQNRVELGISHDKQRRGCRSPHPESSGGVSRRLFLQGMGAAGVVIGGVAIAKAQAPVASSQPIPGEPYPRGKTLRVKPAIIAEVHETLPEPNTVPRSWRKYGDIQTPADLQNEVQRLDRDMKDLAAKSDFPVEFLPIAVVTDKAQAKQVAEGDQDAVLVFGACGYDPSHIASDLASKAPGIVFVRHRTKPNYGQHVTIGTYLLRHQSDADVEPNFDSDDMVVDDYDEIVWRLRALYGLKNAKGTKVLAIGQIDQLGEVYEKSIDIWQYEYEVVPWAEFGKRLEAARADQKVVEAVEQETKDLLAQPNVRLMTERKFVFNTLLARRVAKELMRQVGAANIGMSGCMGQGVITTLDTPPCLLFALLCDEGLTAYCHVWPVHTVPGVLLRWIAHRPAFVCNSHFPHDGIYTVAHCAAPRKMNGRECEPTDIMTHYESDYGAAAKVHYTKGQTVTVVFQAYDGSKWQGFKGKIAEVPSLPACRSQMDIEVEGDWEKLKDQVGFHVLVSYGDWLREVGYVLKKLKQPWENFSKA